MAKEVEAVSGRDVRLEMEVCSDPIPSKTTWDWGSLRVEAGQVNCSCITSVYPSGEQAFYHLLGLAWTILSRANGPTPRT